jgi:hypothetical protein
MDVWNYFNQALAVAIAKNDNRNFLIGALGVRNDGKKVLSSNGAVVINGVKCKAICKSAHAEHRLCRKIDKGAVVFVVRVGRKDGKFRLAKPCIACQLVMRSNAVKKVYYTISDTEYGVLFL